METWHYGAEGKLAWDLLLFEMQCKNKVKYNIVFEINIELPLIDRLQWEIITLKDYLVV